MTDEPQTPPVLPNDPASRTTDGQIKDQSTQSPPPASTTEPSTTSTANTADQTDKSGDKPATAPEKYEFKAPEGFTLDDKQIEAYSAKAKELGLSQDAAQSLVDFYAGLAKEAAEAPYNAYRDQRRAWVNEIVADKTIGNGKDGLNADTKAAIGRVKDTLPADLRGAFEEAMDFTGAGDHPAFVRAMLAFSKLMTEGRPVPVGNPPAPPKSAPSAAQAMWPSLPSARS